MYKKICITNRSLVEGDFEKRIELICLSDVDSIILREKDLSEGEYKELAKRVLQICSSYKKECILHRFVNVAKELKHPYIHISFNDFCALSDKDRLYFHKIGVSTHSVDEAIFCEKMGASYITASHIFHTACKKDLKPRGLDYLSLVCKSVQIPVYALGGICPDNIDICLQNGAKGVCMMSEYMNGKIL